MSNPLPRTVIIVPDGLRPVVWLSVSRGVPDDGAVVVAATAVVDGAVVGATVLVGAKLVAGTAVATVVALCATVVGATVVMVGATSDVVTAGSDVATAPSTSELGVAPSSCGAPQPAATSAPAHIAPSNQRLNLAQQCRTNALVPL